MLVMLLFVSTAAKHNRTVSKTRVANEPRRSHMISLVYLKSDLNGVTYSIQDSERLSNLSFSILTSNNYFSITKLSFANAFCLAANTKKLSTLYLFLN